MNSLFLLLLIAFSAVQPLKHPATRLLSRRALGTSAAAAAAAASAGPASASMAGTQWPLWPALPIAPYGRRKTVLSEIVPGRLWTFDQLLGIFYVHVPIRMSVLALDSGGLCELSTHRANPPSASTPRRSPSRSPPTIHIRLRTQHQADNGQVTPLSRPPRSCVCAGRTHKGVPRATRAAHRRARARAAHCAAVCGARAQGECGPLRSPLSDRGLLDDRSAVLVSSQPAASLTWPPEENQRAAV